MTDTLTIRFEIDQDYEHESPHGGPLPETAEQYAGNECFKDGEPIPYEEYCEYYGNPDRHVALSALLERQRPTCPTCGCTPGPEVVASLHGIDFMDDNPEAFVPLGVRLALDSPEIIGYLRDVTDELRDEAAAETEGAR